MSELSTERVSGWVREYYSVLEFFFWQPAYLDKKKHPESRYARFEPELLAKLQRAEVTLNHLLNIFFSLVPHRILLELFGEFFGRKFEEEFEPAAPHVREISNVVHADMLFIGESSLVAIELKVDAKSDLDQFMKYLLIPQLHCQGTAQAKRLYLLFMGRRQFVDIFQGLVTPDELRASFASWPIPDKAGRMDIRTYRESLRECAKETHIAFVNYGDFCNLLAQKREQLLPPQPMDEVTIKLMDGVIEEIRMRGLAGHD